MIETQTATLYQLSKLGEETVMMVQEANGFAEFIEEHEWRKMFGMIPPEMFEGMVPRLRAGYRGTIEGLIQETWNAAIRGETCCYCKMDQIHTTYRHQDDKLCGHCSQCLPE